VAAVRQSRPQSFAATFPGSSAAVEDDIAPPVSAGPLETERVGAVVIVPAITRFV